MRNKIIVDFVNVEFMQDIIALLRDVIEDDRVPMNLKDEACDKLVRLQARAKVVTKQYQ